MNWVFILVLLVLILSILQGYHKGLLRIIYSLVSWIIILVFVTWATPYINSYLTEHTPIYEKVESHFEEMVRQSAKEQTDEKLDGTTSQLMNLGLKLPGSALNDILEKTSGMADEFMEANGIYGQIAGALAGFVVEGIAFFIALVISWILVHTISSVLGIVSRIPILSGLNRFLGLFAGGIYGLVLVWIAFYIIALTSTSESGQVLVHYIYENPFLKMLYENNAVLTLIIHFL